MNQAKKYHMKLINLKKEMNSLSDKAVRLKVRQGAGCVMSHVYWVNMEGNKSHLRKP